MNKCLVVGSMSLWEREKMCTEWSPAETTEPEPDLGSQETPMKQNGTHVTIAPQGGESCTICPAGLPSWLEARARRWAVPSVVLSLLLSIILIILIVLLAVSPKKSEPSSAGPACPDGWLGYLGKCYYFSQAAGNWTYSQNNCSALGASLAVIDTQQELDALTTGSASGGNRTDPGCGPVALNSTTGLQYWEEAYVLLRTKSKLPVQTAPGRDTGSAANQRRNQKAEQSDGDLDEAGVVLLTGLSQAASVTGELDGAGEGGQPQQQGRETLAEGQRIAPPLGASGTHWAIWGLG